MYRWLLYTGQLYSKYKVRFLGSCLVTVIYRVTAIYRAIIYRFDCIVLLTVKQYICTYTYPIISLSKVYLFFYWKVVQLNEYDKLYLLMSKWKLIRLFNPLCYAGNVTSIEDLESRDLEDLRSQIPSCSPHDLETIQRMIEDSKTVNFEDLPLLLVSQCCLLLF